MKNKKKNNIIDFPTSVSKLERQVEAILFAASEPLDIETIENLMPFELQIYTTLMIQHVEEENERIRQQQGN